MRMQYRILAFFRSGCNPNANSLVKKALRFFPTAAWIGCLPMVSIQPVQAWTAPASIDRAETALKQMQSGELNLAAVTLRQALDADPGESLLHNLAAALLLITGDPAGSMSEWQVSLNDLPDDGLARYGAGLCHLVRGDCNRALDQIQLSAQYNGDRAYCLLAQRYLEFISGATRAGTGMSLPDSFAAPVHAFNGLAFQVGGNQPKALEEMRAALAALPGDSYSEPAGLVMMFDKGRAFRYGSNPLPAGNGLAVSRALREKPFSGVVTLSAGDIGSSASFVMFKIDTGWSTVSNQPPFKLVWDTSKVSNGMHLLEIVVLDRQGQEINRAKREIRTANSNAPAKITPEALRAEKVRAALWPMMMLRPSRAVLCFAAAEAANSTGDKALATGLLERAAAIDPGYRDSITRLAALEGTAQEGSIWRGGNDEKLIALTFDDGPKPGSTEQLLSILTTERVPATFFVIGRHASAYPDLIRKIDSVGMEIENHTYTHPNLTLLPVSSVEQELLRTTAAVRAATGHRTKYYRPPGGNFNSEINRIAAQCGQAPCLWTLDGEALENGSPQRLVEYVVQKASPGAIVLLHNGRLTTIEALPKIIDGLRRRGFSFVTVEQLMARKNVARAKPVEAAIPGGQ